MTRTLFGRSHSPSPFDFRVSLSLDGNEHSHFYCRNRTDAETEADVMLRQFPDGRVEIQEQTIWGYRTVMVRRFPRQS